MPRQESSSGPRWSTGEDGAFFAVRETCARASRRGYPPRLLGLYKTLGGYGVRTGRPLRTLLIILSVSILLQGLLGIYHSTSRPADLNRFPCIQGKNTPFRRLGILEGEAGACSNANAPILEIFYHAAKFTLQSSILQFQGEYQSSTAAGKSLALLMRVIFPLQIFLLLMTIRRRLGWSVWFNNTFKIDLRNNVNVSQQKR